MSESMKVVKFPARDLADIPAALRRIASEIEAGEYGDSHNLAWVIDCGDGRIECGLLGNAPEAGSLGHFLFCKAAHKLMEA